MIRWREDKKALETLRRLAGEGLRAIDIAKEMGVPSRNSIIGAAHRNGIVLRYVIPGQRPKRKRVEGVDMKRIRNTTPTAPVMRVGKAVPNIMTMHRYAGRQPQRCTWHECGEYAVAPGKPYCAAHMETYRKVG